MNSNRSFDRKYAGTRIKIYGPIDGSLLVNNMRVYVPLNRIICLARTGFFLVSLKLFIQAHPATAIINRFIAFSK